MMEEKMVKRKDMFQKAKLLREKKELTSSSRKIMMEEKMVKMKDVLES